MTVMSLEERRRRAVKVRAAVVQPVTPMYPDEAQSLPDALRSIDAAADRGVQILCFPESYPGCWKMPIRYSPVARSSKVCDCPTADVAQVKMRICKRKEFAAVFIRPLTVRSQSLCGRSGNRLKRSTLQRFHCRIIRFAA